MATTDGAQELAEAEAFLRSLPGFDWALSGQQWWTVPEIAAKLSQMGMGVDQDTIRRWFKSYPDTLTLGGQLRITRKSLVMELANSGRNRAVG